MTLVSQIIQEAYRENNLIAINAVPTADEGTEALRLLNKIVLSVFGFDVGEQLSDVNIGDYNLIKTDYTFDTDYPPPNSRLVFMDTSARTIYLTDYPDDGAMMSVIDPYSLLSTANLTLDGNGRTIEGASTLVLSTNSTNKTWIYRADLGNWNLLTTLASTDEMPFPEKFDDYFVGELAIRINGRNKVATSPETMRMLDRMRIQITSRYRQSVQIPVEQGLWVSPWYPWDSSQTDFNKG